LDIGCGFGELLERVESSGRLSVGIDVDPECLQESSAFLEWSEILQTDAICPPFRDDAFDIVIAAGIMEHVDNPTRFLKEAKRICRRTGVFMTPNLGRPSRLIAAARGEVRYERSGHKQGWDYHLFNQVLEHNGWHVDKIVTRFVDFPLYPLFPRQFSRWMSYKVLKMLFPKVGSELFAFCSVE
jgi:2-polyprenyl-3-methyl-5-hydroxy-6-metoxy-1,4-benzoquinol methylase